jgi:hypothetical protein
MNFSFTLINGKLKSAGLGLGLLALASSSAQAQCGYSLGLGCDGTDYTNFGLQSDNNPATIEYDNFTSGFHSSAIRGGDGKFYAWGEAAGYLGVSGNNAGQNLANKTEINSTNYPGLTGTILKTALATAGPSGNASLIVLTTTGLFGGGMRGENGVLAHNSNITPYHSTSSYATNRTFAKLTINGQANGLPSGVTPQQVKMLFATPNTLALVTCSGEAYVLSQLPRMRGEGATSNGSNGNGSQPYKWSRVKTNASGNPNLTGVIAVRGSYHALFALTSSGDIYTWGESTYLGDNNSASNSRTYATAMTKVAGKTIKMIGSTYATSSVSGVSYIVWEATLNINSELPKELSQPLVMMEEVILQEQQFLYGHKPAIAHLQ